MAVRGVADLFLVIRLLRWIVPAMAMMLAATQAHAEYGRVPVSEIDTALFRVDEQRFLGARPDPGIGLTDETGQPRSLKNYEGRPLILVLSYYQCDGTCTVVNSDLADLLHKASGWRLGEDFTVLTVSFDAKDGIDSLQTFKNSLPLPPGADRGWQFTLSASEADAKRLADSVGFKYFWSPQDRAFLHPGLYVFLSAEGRVVRYLYSTNSRPVDIELALTDAKADQIRPSEVLNYALSLCYSYNFKEGRYKLNIPLFAGMGSLLFGVVLFIFSAFVFRRRARRECNQ